MHVALGLPPRVLVRTVKIGGVSFRWVLRLAVEMGKGYKCESLSVTKGTRSGW